MRFKVNGESIAIESVDPHVTLLEWLRNSGRTGSKEGCAEGECGACAVAVVRADSRGKTAYEVVNGCLFPLPAAHGLEIVTVEGVAPKTGALHPVQAAMVKTGGSQCGYCTPGIVVSLFAEYHRPGRGGFEEESFAGHLCRCTGYRPIRDAAASLTHPSAQEPAQQRLALAPTTPQPIEMTDGTHGFARPASLSALFDLWDRFPKATLMAGGTDLMVYANQQHRRFEQLIAVEELEALRGITRSAEEITIGAAEPLAHLERVLVDVPILSQLWPLYSSRLIRNRATLGGNLATASPIGDSAPALLALGAEVTLTCRDGERRLPLEKLFVGYRQTVLGRGELIRQIHIPKPMPAIQRFFKVSKRKHDDISTVAAGFALSLNDAGKVVSLGLGLGGVAATPLKPTAVEVTAVGRTWSRALVTELSTRLGDVGTPMDDFRGSAAYRKAMLGQLLLKFFAETQIQIGRQDGLEAEP